MRTLIININTKNNDTNNNNNNNNAYNNNNDDNSSLSNENFLIISMIEIMKILMTVIMILS